MKSVEVNNPEGEVLNPVVAAIAELKLKVKANQVPSVLLDGSTLIEPDEDDRNAMLAFFEERDYSL